MEKQKICVNKRLAYTEAVSYMKTLVECLESGRIVVQSGEEQVTLTPLENVDIKIEAKAKKDKQKFSFEISWSETVEKDLTITDKEPAAVETPATEKKAEVPADPEAAKSGKKEKTPEKKEKKAKKERKEKHDKPKKK